MVKSGSAQVQNYLVDVVVSELFRASLFPFDVPAFSTKYESTQLVQTVATQIAQIGSSSQISDRIFTILTDKLIDMIQPALSEDATVPDDTNFNVFCERLGVLLTKMPRSSSIITDSLSRTVLVIIPLIVPKISPGPRLEGYVTLLNTLCHHFAPVIFTNETTKQLVTEFVATRVPSLIKTDSSTSLSCLLEIMIASMSALSPSSESDIAVVKTYWTRVLESLTKLHGTECANVLGHVLEALYDSKLDFNFCDERLDGLVAGLVFEKLGKRVSGSDDVSRCVERVIARCFAFDEKRRVLSNDTTKLILSNLYDILDSFKTRYLYTNSLKPTLTADILDQPLAALRVISELFSFKHYATIFPNEQFLNLVSTVFDMSIIQPDIEISKSFMNAFGEPETLDLGTETILETAKEAWESLLENWESEKTLPDNIFKTLLSHWTEKLSDLKSIASPHDLAAQILALEHLPLLTDLQRDDVISTFQSTPEVWSSLSGMFVHTDATVAIVDPLIRLYTQPSQQPPSSTEIKYDHHGLTVYARLILIIVETFKVLTNIEPPVWLLLELSKFMVLYTDTIRLHSMYIWLQDSIVESRVLHDDVAGLLSQRVKSVNPSVLAGLVSSNTLGNTNLVQTAFMKSRESRQLLDIRIFANLLDLLPSDIISNNDDVVKSWLGVIKSSSPTARLPLPLTLSFIIAMKSKRIDMNAFIESYAQELLGVFVSLPVASDIFSTLKDDIFYRLSVLNTLLLPEDGQDFFDTDFLSSDITNGIFAFIEILYNTKSMPIVNAANICVHNEILRLCSSFVPNVSSPQQSQFLFTHSRCAIEQSNPRIPERKVFFHTALTLLHNLILERDMNPDISVAFSTCLENNQFYQYLLQLLLNEHVYANTVPTLPHKSFQTVLAQVLLFTPEKVLFQMKPFDELIALLTVPNEDVQKVVYACLKRIVLEFVQSENLRLELKTISTANDESMNDAEPESPKLLRESLLKLISDVPTQNSVSVDADENDDAPVLHRHKSFGYLLGWMVLFDHFDDATFRLKSILLDQLRDIKPTHPLQSFLEYAFKQLNVGTQAPTFDLSKFTSIETFDLQAGFSMERLDPGVSMNILVSYLYLRSLKAVSGLVRAWFVECKNRQLTLAVESFTEKFFTPVLLSHEYETLSSSTSSASTIPTAQKELLSQLVIKIAKASSEIIASYPIEESSVDMLIKLPRSYPLRTPEVTSSTSSASSSGGGGSGAAKSNAGTSGLPETKWRAWLLASQSVISSQNGGLLDAILVFAKNISGHFDGVEECAICYSIIGVMDRNVPNKCCRTCKKLFHGGCLFKWFRTSNQSTCPLCRSLF